jgi:hypothetical protein
MASGPTLPPQAYTREILTSAFNWLQTQPESARKLATTPDALVGLFMRAQRFGNSSPEQDAPVSSQNFMSDLKSLAEGLKQFEQPAPEIRSEIRNEAPRAIPPEPQRPEAQRPAARDSNRDFGRDSGREPRRPMSQAFAANGSTASYAAGSAWNREFFTETASAAPTPKPEQKTQPKLPPEAAPLFEQPLVMRTEYATGLNERSLAMIQEVKAELNLSSDIEAVNMMLALAYKSLKNLIV